MLGATPQADDAMLAPHEVEEDDPAALAVAEAEELAVAAAAAGFEGGPMGEDEHVHYDHPAHAPAAPPPIRVPPARLGEHAFSSPAGGSVTWTEYDHMRLHAFEPYYFYHRASNSVGSLDESGSLVLYDLRHAKEMLDSQFYFAPKSAQLHRARRLSFFDMWRLDEHKRVADEVGYVVDTTNPRCIQLPFVTAWERASSRVPRPIPPDLVSSTMVAWTALMCTAYGCTAGDVIHTYVVNYWAHALQKPFELPEVALVMIGGKGVGKDTAGELLMALAGEAHSTNYTRTEDLFEKHDTMKMLKLVVKLEDADGKTLHRHRATLRAMITGPKTTVNHKGGKITQYMNLMRLLITANESKVVSLNEEGDRERRLFVTHALARRPDAATFFADVRRLLFCPAGLAILGGYLTARPLGEFHPRVMPANERAEAAYEEDRPATEVYVMDVWDGKECPSAEIWNGYRAWREVNQHLDGEAAESCNVFGRTLSQMAMLRKLTVRVGGRGVRFYTRCAPVAGTQPLPPPPPPVAAVPLPTGAGTAGVGPALPS